jgi:hypothetical protein
MIELSFELTSQDYEMANRQIMRDHWWITVFRYGFMAIVIAAILLLTRGTFWSEKQWWMLIFIMLPVVLMIAYSIFKMPGVMARNRYQAEKAAGMFFVKADADLIRIKTNTCDSGTKWTVYQKLIETENHFFLIHKDNPRCLLILPKRAFESATDIRLFSELAKLRIQSN